MAERADDAQADRAPDGARGAAGPSESVVIDPVFVVTQAFPARPSSIPDIRDFVLRWVGGETEPRLRELRRIHEVFGEAPIG